MIEVQQEWKNAWEKPHYNYPVSYGVEKLLDEDGSATHYRAYARRGRGDDSPILVYSAIYEAYDQADVQTTDHDAYRIQMQSVRDRLISEAAAHRARMNPEKQASLTDMQAHAEKLFNQACREYQLWEAEQERLRVQRIDDDAAIKAARQLVRGLQLLLERGSSEEKALVKSLLAKK